MMETAYTPGIGDALIILFNLLYFVGVMLASSLFIEHIWISRSKWVILPVIAMSILLFFCYPGLLEHILKGVVGPFTLKGILTVTGVGILSGMVMSGL